MIGRLISGSLGRIPAGLAIITVMAVTLSLVAGAALQYAKGKALAYDPLAPRLLPDASQTIDPQLLEGEWVTQYGRYAMSWQVVGNRFEWSMRHKDEPLIVYFCRGDWKLVNNVMVIEQRADMGYPEDPKNLNVRYIPIPMKNMQFFVQSNGVKAQWTIPGTEYSRISGGLFRFFSTDGSTVLDWARR